MQDVDLHDDQLSDDFYVSIFLCPVVLYVVVIVVDDCVVVSFFVVQH